MQSPDFEIERVRRNSRAVAVTETVVAERPFWRLLRFRRKGAPAAEPAVLVAAPMSGHFSWLLRDLVLGLLPRHPVFVLDWRDARDVPLAAGRFGLEDNIAAVVEAVRAVGGRPHVVGMSQSPTAVLAAAALMAAERDPARPRSAILMGGYIDTRVCSNGVTRLAGSLPAAWFGRVMAARVPPGSAGEGRMVWPSWVQWQALSRYLARHVATGAEVGRKLKCDDGEDPARFPFARLYSTLMDLPAELVEENVVAVFHRHALATGRLACRGQPVEPAAITDIGLMTIEGGEDDSSGPGHTFAAHALCPGIPGRLRAVHREPRAGHFGLFHGETWRNGVRPRVEAFIAAVEGA